MSPQPLDYQNPSGPAPRPRCAACGSDLVIEGTLIPGQFRPKKVRRIFSLGALVRVVDVAAVACTACGALSLHIDPAAVVKIAGDPGEGTSPPVT